MGNVERCDKTLPLNEMIYYVRKDADLRARWLTDLEGMCREFGCSDQEIEVLTAVDVRRLMDIGVHQYLIPHILRWPVARRSEQSRDCSTGWTTQCLKSATGAGAR